MNTNMTLTCLVLNEQHSSPSRYGGTKSPTATHSFYMYPPSPGGTHQPITTLGSPPTGSAISQTEISSMMAPPAPAQRQSAANSTKNPKQNCPVPSSLSSNMYSQMYGTTSTAGIVYCSKAVQTDLSVKSLRDIEAKSAQDLETRDTRIDELCRSGDELKRQVSAQQKLIDKQKDHLNKCLDVTKQLLIEKSAMEKKAARQKCMQNRLRLGQFVTQRQGRHHCITNFLLDLFS